MPYHKIYLSAFLVFLTLNIHAQNECYRVKWHQKIADYRANFPVPLDPGDSFGRSVCPLGDMDGDGIDDIAVGAINDDDGGSNRGAFYILYLNANGTVKSHAKVSSTSGGLSGLDNDDLFGTSIANIGDLDNDNVIDLAVNSYWDDDGGINRGAVYILFMNANGTVKSQTKISSISGGFTGGIDDVDLFGTGLISVGDLNGDGTIDLAVGTPGDDDGGTDRGAVWILFLNPNGTVKGYQKISDLTGGFLSPLDDTDFFGVNLISIGDFNGDGLNDIAVGAPRDDDGGFDYGAFYILYLDTNGMVKGEQKISSLTGGFTGALSSQDIFGFTLGNIGDLNNDGVTDIIAGAEGDDDGGGNHGAFWILLMKADATVKQSIKVSDLEGNFLGKLQTDDVFGHATAGLLDYNHDGYTDVAIGAYDDVGGTNKGAVWLITLEECPDSCTAENQKTFEKIYKKDGIDKAHSVINAIDGGYLVVGETNGPNGDWFAMKTDKEGDTIWSKKYSRTGDNSITSIMVRQSADSGYIICGAFTLPGAPLITDMTTLRIDRTGNIIWSRDFEGFTVAQGRDVYPTSDGGYVVCGNTIVFKMNASGVVTNPWRFQPSVSLPAQFTSIRETPEHDLIVAGYSAFGSGTTSAWLVKFDSVGNKLWEKSYDSDFAEEFSSLEITPDHGYIIAGLVSSSSSVSGYDISLVKTDINGQFEWGRTYRGGNSQDRGVSVKITQEGGYIISGYSENFGNRRNIILKTDNYGNIEWSSAYPGNENTPNTWTANNLFQDMDKGFVMANFSSDFSNDNDIYLIKTDNCGNSNCDSNNVEFIIDDLDLIEGNPGSVFTIAGLFHNPFMNKEGFILEDSTLCEFKGDCQLTADFNTNIECLTLPSVFTDISTDPKANIDEWRWDFGDGSPVNNNQNPTHSFPIAGTYFVKLYVSNDDSIPCSDSITMAVTIYDQPLFQLGNDTTLCYGDSLVLDATSAGAVYLWQDNSTNPIFVADTTGTYTAQAFVGSCPRTDSIRVTFQFPPALDLGNDSTLCNGDSLILDATFPGYTNLWQNSLTTTTLKAVSSGLYWAEVSNGICTVSDSIVLQFDTPPVFNLGNDSVLCYGDTVLLDAYVPGSSYQWQDNSTDSVFVADTTGLHYVSVKLGSCTVEDTVNLTFNLPPALDLGNDSVQCEGTILLNATVPGFNYQWQDNSSGSTFLASVTDEYFVEVTDGICTVTDTINLTFEGEPVVSLGNDSSLCEGEVVTLNAFFPGSTYLWSDNSTASALNVNKTGKYFVQVTSSLGACVVSDTINLAFNEIPVITLGSDTALCKGDSLRLSVTYPGATYVWQDNSIGNSFLVTASGTYSVTSTLLNCQSEDAIEVLFDEKPVIDLEDFYEICNKDSLILDIDDQWPAYLWSNGSTDPDAVLDSSGIYWLTVTNGACSVTDTIILKVNAGPLPLIRQSYVLCDGKSVVVDAGNPGSTYKWSTGETTRQITLKYQGVYDVTITTDDGCELRQSFALKHCTDNLFIPNTITPNGDGKNDTWIIRNIDGLPGNKVQIFNRNGHLMFETTNYQNNWNGTYNGEELPATVYYFTLDLNNGTEILKGTLTVIREK